jgi:hypothetical protein
LHDDLASFIDPSAGAVHVFQPNGNFAYPLIEPRQGKAHAEFQKLATTLVESQLSRLDH